MAELNVRGYINNPKVINGTKGPFSVFTLAEGQKQKDGTRKKVFYDCVDFNNADPPPDGSFGTITGWFSPKEYTKKDGTPGHGLSLNVQKIELAPPREGQTIGTKAPPGDGDDFGF